MIGSNFRLYTFINFYLSSIQQGIQTAHIVSELFLKYNTKNAPSKFQEVLNKWANIDKTIVILNGGSSFDIRQDFIKISKISSEVYSIYNQNYDYDHGQWVLPYAYFSEDHNALGAYENGVMTGFGIILPQEIWNTVESNEVVSSHHKKIKYSYNEVCDNRLIKMINFYDGEMDTELISLLKSRSLAR